MKDKLFVVRYYIKAKNASEALRKARKLQADEVWIDEDWKKGNAEELTSAIGFETETSNENGQKRKSRETSKIRDRNRTQE